MSKSYELSSQTIKDIIDNIPPERWDACIDEMKVAIKQISSVVELVKATVEYAGLNPSDIIQYPDTIKWIDDGLNKNTLKFRNQESGEIVGEISMSTDGQYTDQTNHFGEDVR